MKDFNFTLVYKLPKDLLKPQDLVDNLVESGCSDAFTGAEDRKKVSLSFNIEAYSLSQAVTQARYGVSTVVVGAELKEIQMHEQEEEDTL